MALRFPGRVKAQTSTTGTGAKTISEPGQPGWRTITRAVADGDLADGDTLPCIFVDTTVTNGPKLLEIGTYTWNNTTKTLTAVTIYQPNAAAVDWGAGTRDVVVIDNPVLFLLLAGGTMTGILNILISGSIISPDAATSLLVQRSASSATSAGISIIAGNAAQSRLYLGDTNSESVGGLVYDHSTNTLNIRTSGADRLKLDNSGVLKDASNVPYDKFASGGTVKWAFYMPSAPSGWTKDTTHNDKAFRVVSGTGGGSGGSASLSTASTGLHTLTEDEIPAHTHRLHVNLLATAGATVNIGDAGGGGGFYRSGDLESTGGGSAHSHTLSLAYVDLIICSKN